MRGKVTDFHKVKASGRITPAYAGKSQKLWISDKSQEDHPRLCGEKSNCFSENGLSVRITPAYAGKSIDSSFAALL